MSCVMFFPLSGAGGWKLCCSPSLQCPCLLAEKMKQTSGVCQLFLPFPSLLFHGILSSVLKNRWLWSTALGAPETSIPGPAVRPLPAVLSPEAQKTWIPGSSWLTEESPRLLKVTTSDLRNPKG